MSLETTDSWATFFGGKEILERKILTPEQECKKIDKITQSDILKVARDIFQPQKLNLALIGPFKKREKFKELLKL